MKINSTIRSFSALYDFNVNGGAIGTINLGIFFKPNTKFQSWNFYIISNLASDSNSLFSFGLTGISATVMFEPNTYDGYEMGESVYAYNVVSVPSTGSQLTMSISGADLTAGKILFNAIVFEMDI